MSRDVIHSQKPKAKATLTPTFSRIAPPLYPFKSVFDGMKQHIFQRHEIKLDQYRPVGTDEFIKEDDIYFERGTWIKTLCGGRKVSEMDGQNVYYRKKVFNERPPLDEANFRFLAPHEIIEPTDEFFNTGDKTWHKSGNVFDKVGDVFFYRRALKRANG